MLIMCVCECVCVSALCTLYVLFYQTSQVLSRDNCSQKHRYISVFYISLCPLLVDISDMYLHLKYKELIIIFVGDLLMIISPRPSRILRVGV